MASGAPRTTLDRYELYERIAVGGMAEVFRAKAYGAHGFEKVLAIKRILPELLRDPEFESRFISEAKLAVTLTHANIVQVFDFGRFGGTLYIAMELVDGLDLAALLRALGERKEACGMGAALQIAIEVTKGLDFAHKRGVVHRDVSPSNILLSRGGEVKIADFGIALAAEGAPAASGVRRIMGKWRYMSPEQARGEKLDPRSDLFSAGVVLWELFTGKKLFPGDEIEDVVRNVREMVITPPSEVRPELPPALDAVLGRCLERDPGKRWATAGELHRALVEISYERTLMVTALDVSELVARVRPGRDRPPSQPPPPMGGHDHDHGHGHGHDHDDGAGATGVDDLIRAQLLGGVGRVDDGAGTDVSGEAALSRVTAHASGPPRGMEDDDHREHSQTTIVVRGVGPDGVTEFDAAPPDPVAVTERGPPPPASAPVPGARAATQRLSDDERPPVPRRVTSRRGFVIGGVAATGGIVLAVLGLRGRDGGDGGQAPGAAASVADAAPRPTPVSGIVDVFTEPPGATVLIDGTEHSERTPSQVTVAAGSHSLELRLVGHRTHAAQLDVAAGERLRYVRPLEPMRATLAVRSAPAGAGIELDGKVLGVTPLTTRVSADGQAHVLRLTRAGFRPIEESVELVDGATVDVERTLEPAVRWGHVNLQVEPWAYVYLDGKRIAEAPVAGLRLPVGRQSLRLEHPPSGAVKSVVVDVPEKGTPTVSFTLP